MLKLAEYLHRAAECRDLARTTTSPSHRAELEKMALNWENLAEQRKQRLNRKVDLDLGDIDPRCVEGVQRDGRSRWR
jgi:hypothetical protein